jgi:hypothetical protein
MSSNLSPHFSTGPSCARISRSLLSDVQQVSSPSPVAGSNKDTTPHSLSTAAPERSNLSPPTITEAQDVQYNPASKKDSPHHHPIDSDQPKSVPQEQSDHRESRSLSPRYLNNGRNLENRPLSSPDISYLPQSRHVTPLDICDQASVTRVGSMNEDSPSQSCPSTIARAKDDNHEFGSLKRKGYFVPQLIDPTRPDRRLRGEPDPRVSRSHPPRDRITSVKRNMRVPTSLKGASRHRPSDPGQYSLAQQRQVDRPNPSLPASPQHHHQEFSINQNLAPSLAAHSSFRYLLVPPEDYKQIRTLRETILGTCTVMRLDSMPTTVRTLIT